MTERLDQRSWFRLSWRETRLLWFAWLLTLLISGDIAKNSESSALLQSFCHFTYNENPTRALNTTSLKCCLPSTDAIDRREKFTYAYGGSRSPHASASLTSTRFSQKKKGRILFFKQSSINWPSGLSLPTGEANLCNLNYK